MKDEIKEIDITKDLYLCSPLLNTECTKENCYINNGPCCHTVNKEHSQQYLLDYITNLQEEINHLKQNKGRTLEYIEKGNKHFKENYNEPYEYAFMVNADEIMKILKGKSDE